MSKYAVIVIDMLNDFVTGPITTPRVQKIISPIKDLCEKARKAGVPVIYTNDAHHHEIDREFKVWGPHAVIGTKGAEVIDELKPQPGDIVVPKKTYTAFYNTPLENILKELDVDTLILTGWQAECCCRHTAADAFFRGFNIVVPRETIEGTTEEKYQESLENMASIYAAQLCSVTELKF